MFDQATRRYLLPLPAQTKGAGVGAGVYTWELPPSAILARIWLMCTGLIAGVTVPNALGQASIIRRARLTANSGQDLFNTSGAGYHYLIRQFTGLNRDPFPGSTSRAAVAGGAHDVSMLLECQINPRDPLGLIMLQNRQTVLTLSVDMETDATVTGAGTYTATIRPWLELYSVPQKPEDYPNFGVVNVILEDTQAVGGAMDFIYEWQRGGTYYGVFHGFGIGAAPADSWTQARVRTNQSNYIEDVTPLLKSAEFAWNHPGGVVRNLGLIPFDWLGSSGLNYFGVARDMLNSQVITNIETVLTTTGAGTLYTVRKMLVPLG